MDKTQIKNALPFICLVLISIITISTLSYYNIGLDDLQAHKDKIQRAATAYPALSFVMFSGLYIFSVALSLPIATLLTLLAGFLFGPWLGTLIVVISATLGATILFVIAGTSLGAAMRTKLAKNKGTAYEKIAARLRENAAGYLLFMRLVPLFPFWLVNIAPALIGVKLHIFVATTFFGIIPGSFVFVNVGKELGAINSLSGIISPSLLLAFALLGLFALLPSFYKAYKNRSTGKAPPS